MIKHKHKYNPKWTVVSAHEREMFGGSAGRRDLFHKHEGKGGILDETYSITKKKKKKDN